MPRLLLLLAFLGLNAYAADVKWGKVVCSSVTQADANTYAQANPFIYGNTQPPPGPSGTLTCALPLKIETAQFEDGTQYLDIHVSFDGAPKSTGDCTVDYFNGRKSRHFSPDGSGEGMANADGTDLSVDVSFSDLGSAELDDSFVADSLNETATTTWVPEYKDDLEAQPIISTCHVEM